MKKNYENMYFELITWLRNYFSEPYNLDAKAVIGISGGKDSSVAAALLCEAIGSDRIIAVKMPNGKQEDIEIANKLIDYLDIKNAYEINISSILNSMVSQFIISGVTLSDQAIINMQPRIRMNILYSIAASYHGRVCNTSNFCEKIVGYCTKWGDMAGDFSPLGGLLVSDIIELGRILTLPEDFLLKPPSDGLTGKTDEEVLGISYSDIEKFINDEFLSAEALNKIVQKYEYSKHKRESIPTFYYGYYPKDMLPY